jgi:predicted dehydrogenase
MKGIYRAGIVGAGQIGRAHAVGYHGTEEIELVAVTEPNDRVRKAFQEEYNIPTGYTDMKEMLDSEDLDYVSICTWHLLHEPQSILAAGYLPKAIICEKPMSVGMGSVEHMIKICDDHKVKLVIGHQRRFYHSWTKARELILDGVIGEPQMVTAKSGEGLLNCGTHVIDACRYLLGDPETEWVIGALERKTDRYEREVRIEDACMVLIQFQGGAQALVQSDLTPSRWSVEEYQVKGSDGVLEVDARRLKYVNGSTSGWITLEPDYEDPWILQARATVRYVEPGGDPRGNARQAAHTVEIMMALYQSARDHAVIHLPLKEKGYPVDLMFDEGKIPVEEPGAYDIRSFLAMEPEERAKYNEMRSQGMRHKDIADALKRNV